MKNKSCRIGIWGWWQGGNLGDNWIKKIMHDTFPFAEMVPTTVRNFDEYDFMICGGGGLFIYDVIEPWDEFEKLKLPFGMIGLGAEFPHKTNRAIELEKQAKFFFVRDAYSRQCMKLDDRSKSYDCTFIEPLNWAKKEEIDINKLFFVWRDGKERYSNNLFREYINPIEEPYTKWTAIIDQHFIKKIEENFQTIEDDVEGRIEDCGFVISGRYHGIIAAIQKGLPFVAIDICPKIRALLVECELEEYCVKISETDKIEELIVKAKDNIDQIRQKEWAFRTKAYNKMCEDVKKIYYEIFKATKMITGIHYGSYWMKDNDIVNVMSDDLANLCTLHKIDLKIYGKKPDSRVKAIIKEPNTVITLLDHKKIVRDIRRLRPDFIVLNSGGLVLEDKTFKLLKKQNIKTIGLELSDPDVYPYNGAVYGHKFDWFYTNSKLSYNEQYDHKKVNIGIMPFAASAKHHYYMPEVERKYDIVVVGHAREDRKVIVDALQKKYKVGAYGLGWDNSLGVVNGSEHVKAINSGKMYLSFAKTVAGYSNVKVGLFEAMACNQVVITDYMEELQDYFDVGKEVLCYKNVEELLQLVDYYMTHEEELEQVRSRAYARFLKEHTYEKRWVEILREVVHE